MSLKVNNNIVKLLIVPLRHSKVLNRRYHTNDVKSMQAVSPSVHFSTLSFLPTFPSIVKTKKETSGWPSRYLWLGTEAIFHQCNLGFDPKHKHKQKVRRGASNAAPGFNPKYIINVFKANLVQICICTDERTKINKKSRIWPIF